MVGKQASQTSQPSARVRLAAMREKKAPTKAVQIRALWREIKAHSMRCTVSKPSATALKRTGSPSVSRHWGRISRG
jgi:hypothetical protein